MTSLILPSKDPLVEEVKRRPVGVQLRHDTLRTELFTIENRKRPYGDGGYDCNICVGVHHRYKTTHLFLDDTGSCMVSVGVKLEIEAAGWPKALTIVTTTNHPPPLRVGRIGQYRTERQPSHVEFRRAVDQINNRIWWPDGHRFTTVDPTTEETSMTMRQAEPREPLDRPLTDEELRELDDAYAAAKTAGDASYNAQDRVAALQAQLAAAKREASELRTAWDETRKVVEELELRFGVGYYGTGAPASLAKMGVRTTNGGE